VGSIFALKLKFLIQFDISFFLNLKIHKKILNSETSLSKIVSLNLESFDKYFCSKIFVNLFVSYLKFQSNGYAINYMFTKVYFIIILESFSFCCFRENYKVTNRKIKSLFWLWFKIIFLHFL